MANANISALTLNQQNMITPATTGGTLGVSLGTGSTQVLAANPQRQKVTFANPGSQIIYVCQAVDSAGNALTAGPNPGNWPVFPGGILPFTGDGVAGAWLAEAAANSGNPFTVASSATL
jgi:hypothetical protein